MNLANLYPIRISYYDEIEIGTVVHAGNGMSKWINVNKHPAPILMQVSEIIKCNRSLIASDPECAECKIRKWYRLSLINNTTPFCDMCANAIYDIRGRQYEMR